MGFLDGLSFAMRQTVLHCAKDAGITLTPKQHAELKNQYLGTLESFKLAFKLFPRLVGSDYALDVGGEEWRGLLRVAKVRNNLTHPKVLEHLAFHPALPALVPTIRWVSREILTLLNEVSRRTGLASRPVPIGVEELVFRESESPWNPVFKDEDYRLIKSYGDRTLEYVKHMFFMLSDDTKTAMELTRGTLASHSALLSPRSQFTYRTYARTLFSEIEGAIAAARFFIDAAVDRGGVSLSGTDVAHLDEGEIEDRLVATANLWSREFGNGYTLGTTGQGWKHLRGALAFRNRVTHPKNVESLRVDLALTETLVGAHGLFIEAWGEGFYLDPERWAEKAGGIEEAIREEEQRAQEERMS